MTGIVSGLWEPFSLEIPVRAFNQGRSCIMRVDCVALASELRPGSSPVEAAEIFESSDVLWSLQPSGLV